MQWTGSGASTNPCRKSIKLYSRVRRAGAGVPPILTTRRPSASATSICMDQREDACEEKVSSAGEHGIARPAICTATHDQSKRDRSQANWQNVQLIIGEVNERRSGVATVIRCELSAN